MLPFIAENAENTAEDQVESLNNQGHEGAQRGKGPAFPLVLFLFLKY